MIGSEHLSYESSIVPVDIRRDGLDVWSKRAPQTYPVLHSSSAGVLNSGDGQPAFRQFGRGVAQPDVHIKRNVKLGPACTCDLVQKVCLMVELKKFVGITAEDVSPGPRLFVCSGQHVCRYLPLKFLV